jgi:hypothetical protein
MQSDEGKCKDYERSIPLSGNMDFFRLGAGHLISS